MNKDIRRTYVFRTPGLMTSYVMKNGKKCFDSYIEVWAQNFEEAQKRYIKYKQIGKELGVYR